MPPMPNRSHQELELDLGAWLRTYWARPRGNKVYPPINLALPGRWPEDYRIPDLVLLTPDRFHIDRNEYFDGGPTVVVEIRSPGDESYEKLPFYAQLQIPEVWIIDRDTRQPEVLRLMDAEYQSVAARSRWMGREQHHGSPHDGRARQAGNCPGRRSVVIPFFAGRVT